jgi:transposase, IS5 family
VVCADEGYTGDGRRAEHEGRQVIWQIAAPRRLTNNRAIALRFTNPGASLKKAKTQVRAKFERPFRVIKRQSGYVKTRFRGLAKNTAQLSALFALSNLWMAWKARHRYRLSYI